MTEKFKPVVVEAEYIGPYAKVLIPNSGGKVWKRNDPAPKIRVRYGHPIGADWNILKGKKDYDAMLKQAQAEADERAKERKARRDATAAKAEALSNPTVDEKPKPAKKGGAS